MEHHQPSRGYSAVEQHSEAELPQVTSPRLFAFLCPGWAQRIFGIGQISPSAGCEEHFRRWI